MSTTFPFRILTPAGELFSADATSVLAQLGDGGWEILAHHEPTVAALQPAILRVDTANGPAWHAHGPATLHIFPSSKVLLLAAFIEAADTEEAARAVLEKLRPQFEFTKKETTSEEE